MEYLFWLVILALIIGYLNLGFILFKEKSTINIYNKSPEEKAYRDTSVKNTINFTGSSEIPVESSIIIKDLPSTVNINSEKLKSSNVKELVNKIKNVRRT